jgi:nucleoside-diphosphate-sugar epimerase
MWRGLVVRALMQMAKSSGVINIMGDGKQTREFMYVGDLCEAQSSIIEEKTANKTYYLTGDNPISVESLAKEVVKYYPAKIEYIPQGRVEPKLTSVNNEKVKKDLNWSPRTSLEDGIKKCVEWWESLSPAEKEEDYWC